MGRRGFVYIITNAGQNVLYTGVTSDVMARIEQHRSGAGSRFTSRYRAHKLVYCEEHAYMREAIEREKQIKAGSRQRKIQWIESVNPEWRDLSEDWRV